jgi:hypothetical protein
MTNDKMQEITIKSSENSNTGEIVLFQPNNSVHLEVRIDKGELESNSVYSILEYTANDGKIYNTQFYNLDAILSIGYRVK